MRLIDADALIRDLEHDVAVDQDILHYPGTEWTERKHTQFDLDCKQYAIYLLTHEPNIKTKQIKYYDDKEQVWKVGSVIVDEGHN